MPRFASDTGPRILEGLELEAMNRESQGVPELLKSASVRADEMHHRLPLPDMAVQPQPAIHRVDHPIATEQKLPASRRKNNLPQALGAPAGVMIVEHRGGDHAIDEVGRRGLITRRR